MWADSPLIPGKNPGNGIAQSQADHGQRAGNRSQMISYIAFNVKLFMDRLLQFGHGVMELAALIRSAPFQFVYRNSAIHAVLASFWIQAWSCFRTSMVRVGFKL